MKAKTIIQKVREQLKNRKPIKYSEQVCSAVSRLRKQGVKINSVKKMKDGKLVTYYYNGSKL